MAKKQTRRSISVSRATYERLKTYCETNGLSMSQFVEHRVGDFLGRSVRPGAQRPMTESAAVPSAPVAGAAPPRPVSAPPPVVSPAQVVRPVERRPAPPPAKPTADSIFTF